MIEIRPGLYGKKGVFQYACSVVEFSLAGGTGLTRERRMNRPRASISQILAVVALAGADLAIYRFAKGSDAYGMDLYRLTALAPACLALNVAAFVALFARGRSRAFCVGYVLFGIAAVSSLLLGLNDPPYETIDCYEDHHMEHRSYPGGRWPGCAASTSISHTMVCTAWALTTIRQRRS
jgi:hypothetical protein